MLNIANILNGWKNFLVRSEVTEKLARERAEHCATCEHAKHGLLTAFIDDDLTEIQGEYCSKCEGCPLSAKVRSENEKCPVGKW